MSLLDLLLGSALIIESLFLVVFICFYKKEKAKAKLEKIKRAEERKYLNIFLEHIEKQSETYEILLEFKRILEDSLKDDKNERKVNAEKVSTI
jgi:hypothetical protein